MQYIRSFLFQWRFLTRDDGEKDPSSDPGWIQDEGMSA